MSIERWIATFGGAGRLKPAPGTWGSAAALALSFPLNELGGRPALAVAAALTLAVGLWASGAYSRAIGLKDPSEVVIDEAAGIFLVFACVELTWSTAIAGFLLFRFFDIVKPWPISWANRAVPGAVGIMLDDCLAGFGAAGALWLAARFLPTSGL